MYTNIINIPESILFLTSARLAVREAVNVSESLDEETKEFVAYYVMNEATDYEIMSMVINEEVAEKKYSLEDEIQLFDKFRESVVENYHELSEFMEKEDIFSMIYEIGPVSVEGISTAAPILEHLYDSGILLEKKARRSMKDVAFDTQFKARAAKKKGAHKAKGLAKDVAGVAADVGAGVAAGSGKVAQKAKDIAFDTRFKARGAKKKLAHKAKGAAATIKGGAKKAGGTVSGAAGKAASKAKGAAFDVQFKARGLKKSIPHKLKGAGITGAKAAKGLGAVALATAAIYAGVKAYQRFLSQAARACSGFSGSAKTQCMQKYKANGLRAQITATSAGMNKCSQAKNPEKCRAAIQNRVTKLKAKLAKMSV